MHLATVHAESAATTCRTRCLAVGTVLGGESARKTLTRSLSSLSAPLQCLSFLRLGVSVSICISPGLDVRALASLLFRALFLFLFFSCGMLSSRLSLTDFFSGLFGLPLPHLSICGCSPNVIIGSLPTVLCLYQRNFSLLPNVTAVRLFCGTLRSEITSSSNEGPVKKKDFKSPVASLHD